MALKNVMNVDPRLPVVPVSLVNYITRKIIWYAFSAFRSKCAQITADGMPAGYAERMSANGELYDDVNARLEKVTPAAAAKPPPPPDGNPSPPPAGCRFCAS